VKCGEVFEVPAGFEKKARGNAAFEIVEDAAPDPAAASEEVPAAPKAARKRKEKDHGEPVA
jgi:hypothetical protein